MRSNLKSIIAVAAIFLVAPWLAVAGEREMSGAVATISADEIQKVPAKNLSSFLADTNFGGSVAASYFYNTRGMDSGQGENANLSSLVGGTLLHRDSNSFHLDELWFSANNPATAEGRGGFEFDLVMGETADIGIWGGSTNGKILGVLSANASYLVPVAGANIELKAGRFTTHIGSESMQSTANFNITRGLLWNTQPINHTGVTIASSYESGLDWMIGVANNSGPVAIQTDTDDNKVLLWHLGFQASDELSVQLNGLYGSNCQLGGGKCVDDGRDRDRHGVVDLILNWDPTDQLSLWVNTDYMWASKEGRGSSAGDPALVGFAAAGRYAASDKCGIALRTEYIHFWDNWVNANTLEDHDDSSVWSITGTLDHKFGNHVTLKGEAVYQLGDADNTSNAIFFQGRHGVQNKNDQLILGAQLIYQF
jgi:hypothetical protein